MIMVVDIVVALAPTMQTRAWNQYCTRWRTSFVVLSLKDGFDLPHHFSRSFCHVGVDANSLFN